MTPLLEITRVPIEIQVKTTDATLEYSRGTVEMEVSREESGNVNVRSRPAQLRLDTFERRGAARPTVRQAPSAPTYEATSAYADQGAITLSARIGQQSGAAASGEYDPTAYLPFNNGGEDSGSMEIRYQMDKLNFDWKIGKGEFKFTPGDIEFTVEQMPSITIKYNGGPIYVPRSADPNYKPVDVQA